MDLFRLSREIQIHMLRTIFVLCVCVCVCFGRKLDCLKNEKTVALPEELIKKELSKSSRTEPVAEPV